MNYITINPHPVDYLLTYGHDYLIVDKFIRVYLRPAQLATQAYGGHIRPTGCYPHGPVGNRPYVYSPLIPLDTLLFEVERKKNW